MNYVMLKSSHTTTVFTALQQISQIILSESRSEVYIVYIFNIKDFPKFAKQNWQSGKLLKSIHALHKTYSGPGYDHKLPTPSDLPTASC